jgi:hypothetical protein
MSKKRSHAESKDILFGVAYYSSAQWPKLLAAAADREVLEDTHDEWVAFYNSTVAKLGAAGGKWVRVPIDVDELAAWCAQQGRPLNGATRAEFTALKTRELHGATSEA